MRLTLAFAAALTAALPLALPIAAPAHAAVDSSDPGKFIDTLADEGFGVLRGGDKAAARAKFRTMLAQHFAVDAIGERLIRRWSPTITPQQRAAYKAAFPSFIIGTYADRLFEYATADLQVIRTTPNAAGANVLTNVTKTGSSPVKVIWAVQKSGAGYKVTNLTVSGVNLAISQAADFDAIVQRKGFDALVSMMKSRG